MNYSDFIAAKRHSTQDAGITAKYLPDCMFDFQKYVAEYCVKRGRCAVFLDTGLGKTLIEIVTAINYVRHTNKPVLIITPLAVAFQFIKEAEKFDLGKLEYSRDGKYTSDIVICNYERLDKFNPSDFDCVILDESSILKNYDGAIKAQVTQFLKRVKYRYLFTATPSPNDFIELGTSSEALGYMGYTDMLSTYFTNNEDTIKPQNIGTKWILKGHAHSDFFKWVSGWSISMRKPSDLGFSDDKHILPELKLKHHAIKNPHNLVVNGQIQIFNQVAKRLTEVREEQRATIPVRCEKAAELGQGQTCVYWANFNREADLIEELDSDAIQIKGTMKLDKKEEILLAFGSGEIKRLITKAKITAFGLNWQHCNKTIFFPTFSYEQYYQAVRRFWRFGQTRPVTVDLVYSDGQKRVIDSLLAKAQKASELFDNLNHNINAQNNNTANHYNQMAIMPQFLST